MAETIKSLTGTEAAINFDAPRDGDIRDSLGDPERMQRLLGFTAETTLEDGLSALLAANASAKLAAE